MKKFICGLLKLAAVLAVLGALLYAAVLYWDKIMELFCKAKSLVSRGEDCCCADEFSDYADWEEE